MAVVRANDPTYSTKKSWTPQETADALFGTDSAMRASLIMRFPNTVWYLAQMATAAPKATEMFLRHLPADATMRKIELNMTGAWSNKFNEDGTVYQSPFPDAPKEEKEEEAIPEDEPVNKLEGADIEDVDDDEIEDNDPGYDVMTVVELYKECKARGINVKPKQKADVYIDLLKKDDEAQNKILDDDDWDDAENEPEPPKEPEKKQKPKKGKKEETKKPADDDGEDDWEFGE